MSDNAGRDENRVTTLLVKSNDGTLVPIDLYADSVTHRLLVNSTITGAVEVASDVNFLVSLNAAVQEMTSRLAALAATMHSTNQSMRVTVVAAIPTSGISDATTTGAYGPVGYIKFVEIMATQNANAVVSNINNVTT